MYLFVVPSDFKEITDRVKAGEDFSSVIKSEAREVAFSLEAAINYAIDCCFMWGSGFRVLKIFVKDDGSFINEDISQKWFIEKCAEHYLKNTYSDDCYFDENGAYLLCEDWVKETDAYEDLIAAANEDFSEGSDAQEHSTYWGHP